MRLEEMMPTLLISSCADDHIYLANLFESLSRKLYVARTRAQAQSYLRNPEVSLILCERDLADGSWKDVLSETAGRDAAPLLIVVSTFADDRLWTEVLELGGYDVVAKPFVPKEMVRVLNLAWHPRAQPPASGSRRRSRSGLIADPALS